MAVALTGALAAYRSQGLLRVWITYEVLATVALKASWELWHAYKLGWMIAEPISMVLAGAVVLERSKPQRWPFYALAAAVVHGWAMEYPNRWPGSWLQLEIHLVAFSSLLLGLFMLGSLPKRENAAITVLLLMTAASFYAVPWHMDIRVPLMYGSAGVYFWIATQCREPRELDSTRSGPDTACRY